jgi:DNA repair exonuclease SbcCD ATPase subunit
VTAKSNKATTETKYEGFRFETCSTEPKNTSVSQSISKSRGDPHLVGKIEQMALQITTLQRKLETLRAQTAGQQDYVPRRLLEAVEAQLDAALTEKEELQELRHTLLAEWRAAENRAEQLQKQVGALRQSRDLNAVQDLTERLKSVEGLNMKLVTDNSHLRCEVSELQVTLNAARQQLQSCSLQTTSLKLPQDADPLGKSPTSREFTDLLEVGSVCRERENRIKELELEVEGYQAKLGEMKQCTLEWLAVTATALERMVIDATAGLEREMQAVRLALEEKTQRLEDFQYKLKSRLESSTSYDLGAPSLSHETTSRLMRALQFECTSLQSIMRTEPPAKRKTDELRCSKAKAKVESLSKIIKMLVLLH